MIVGTLEQRCQILRHYFVNIMEMLQNVCENCVRILEEDFGIPIDKPKREKPKAVCTPENIAVVAERVCEARITSIHRLSQQLNISETSFA